MVNHVRTALLSLGFALLPGVCVLCGMTTRRNCDLCLPCEADLPWIYTRCQLCGVSMPLDTPMCSTCACTLPAFTGLFAPFRYEFPVDVMIQKFKDQWHMACGDVLSQLLAAHAATHFSQSGLLGQNMLVIPTPLHPHKRRQRGFNQSLIIARTLANKLQMQLDEQSLTRVKQTLDQKSLAKPARRANLTGAFQMNETARSSLEGRHVLLVDDVVTTGETVVEITHCLKEAGATSVYVVSIARTSPARETTL